MRIATTVPAIVRARIIVLAVVLGALSRTPAPCGDRTCAQSPPVGATDARFAPYAADPEQPWNRLHKALFVRDKDGVQYVHSTDPLLYRGGTHLLDGKPQRKAVALLDEFLARSEDRLINDPLKRLFFQHDLWSAFDYVAWYPDDWAFKSKDEAAAVALRNRLAKAIGRLALDDHELAAVPDNYALAVNSKHFAADYDSEHPDRPFLPPNLFDEKGPWVRFHPTTDEPTAPRHFLGAGGRAVHFTFLRLPGGRAATEQYLKELRVKEPKLQASGRYSLKQFPVGTMVALVRRALTVDRSAKVRVTPITELVQIRVYRRIPTDPEADLHEGDGEQAMYEFLLDRQKLFASEHGLRPFGRDDPAEPFFDRHHGADPFEGNGAPLIPKMQQLRTCIQCHTRPGVFSVVSIPKELRTSDDELVHTYSWDVELNYTVTAKVKQFSWGLLQGKLESK